MSTRSDVFLALQAGLASRLPSEYRTILLVNYKAEELTDDQGVAFVMGNVVWDAEDDFVRALNAWLNTRDPEQFILIEVCPSHPSHDSGDRGSWTDNPWDAQRCLTASLEFHAG